jgi:hypothetical protein
MTAKMAAKNKKRNANAKAEKRVPFMFVVGGWGGFDFVLERRWKLVKWIRRW